MLSSIKIFKNLVHGPIKRTFLIFSSQAARKGQKGKELEDSFTIDLNRPSSGFKRGLVGDLWHPIFRWSPTFTRSVL